MLTSHPHGALRHCPTASLSISSCKNLPRGSRRPASRAASSRHAWRLPLGPLRLLPATAPLPATTVTACPLAYAYRRQACVAPPSSLPTLHPPGNTTPLQRAVGVPSGACGLILLQLGSLYSADNGGPNAVAEETGPAWDVDAEAQLSKLRSTNRNQPARIVAVLSDQPVQSLQNETRPLSKLILALPGAGPSATGQCAYYVVRSCVSHQVFQRGDEPNAAHSPFAPDRVYHPGHASGFARPR